MQFTKKKSYAKINISSSFIFRAHCKKCGSMPKSYFMQRNPFIWKDPRNKIISLSWIKSFTKRMNDDNVYFFNSKPRFFNKAQYFSFTLEDKSFNPSLHKKIGTNYSSIIECISCKCGATIWCFNQASNFGRIEIVNRKGKYTSSVKYKDYFNLDNL